MQSFVYSAKNKESINTVLIASHLQYREWKAFFLPYLPRVGMMLVGPHLKTPTQSMILFSKLITNFQSVSNFFPRTILLESQWKEEKKLNKEIFKRGHSKRDGTLPNVPVKKSRHLQLVPNKTIILTDPWVEPRWMNDFQGLWLFGTKREDYF